MKTPSTSLPLALCLGLIFITACVSTKPRYARPTDFVEPMEKLASAVDAELHNPFTATPPSGTRLLKAAMNHKPELKKAFKSQSLLVTNWNDNAVVLLLSPTNRTVAWIENASWSSHVTKFHFLSNPPSPAQFTIPLP